MAKNDNLETVTSQTAEVPVEEPALTRSFSSLFTDHLPLQNETTYFIFANVMDIFMTYMLLRYGAIEANPFANFVLVRWGFWGMIGFKLVIVAGVCVIAQIVALTRPKTAKGLLLAGTAVVAAVVVYSMLLFSMHAQGAPSY